MPFDINKANRAINFIKMLKHTKGKWAGKPFQLMDWQIEEVLKPIFGNVDKRGKRIIRKAYVEIPKKNGKSELAAAIALFMLCADNEGGAEVYSAAADRQQASIVFNVAAQMVRTNNTLYTKCKVLDSVKRITYPETGSYYQVLSSDVKTKHGFNTHACMFDELHAQPNRDLWDVLTEGSGDAREQPLVFALTTAGYDRNSICWEMHEYARKVKEGIIKDPHFLPVIYKMDEEKDWEDEKNWLKANPSMGHIIDIKRVRVAFKEAKEIPAKENLFRRLRLDQWVKQAVRFIPMEFWNKCNGKVDEEILVGRGCMSGLDLASTGDITALVHVFPPQDETEPYVVLPRFFIPEDNMKKREDRDGVPYSLWVKQGFVTATPGNTTDYEFVKKQISDDAEKFDISEIAFDRWGATKIINDLHEMGFEDEKSKHANRHLIQFGQGFASMAAPTKELLRLILSVGIIHGDNPVLNWMADNMVVRQDPAGNIKPDKEKSTEKIDGIVALIMGLDRATRQQNYSSVYEERGVLTF